MFKFKVQSQRPLLKPPPEREPPPELPPELRDPLKPPLLLLLELRELLKPPLLLLDERELPKLPLLRDERVVLRERLMLEPLPNEPLL